MVEGDAMIPGEMPFNLRPIEGCECPNCIRFRRDLAERKMQEGMAYADEYIAKRKEQL